MTLTRDEARAIVERAMKVSKADECLVSLRGDHDAHVRFAKNEVTTSGDVEDVQLSVEASFGKRSGRASVNQFDDASLERCVRQAEEIARFSPEDPEHMAVVGSQEIKEIAAFSEETAALAPERRAELARRAIDLAKAKNVVIAGFFTTSGSVRAVGSSRGLFGYHRQTRVTFSATARTPDGKGSGWAGTNAEAWKDVDAGALAQTAVDKAFRSAGAKELAPGTYTVILEPAAVGDLVLYMGFAMEARQADEGRSFFAKKGGGNKIGERVVSDKVTIWTDPADPRAPGAPFSREGLPTRKMNFIENGVVSNLFYSRFWAEKQGKQPTPDPENAFMKGGTGSIQDLIAGTRKGVLVTRLWYIRFVDPQSLLLTGLTRDGTFLIENGKVRSAVKNFRWNDSPIAVFSKIEAMSREVRARGAEGEDMAVVCPAIRTQMTFSSLSDAV